MRNHIDKTISISFYMVFFRKLTPLNYRYDIVYLNREILFLSRRMQRVKYNNR